LNRIYLVTGANGHLGRTIVRQLTGAGARVRGLVLPGDEVPLSEATGMEIVRGDVCDIAALRPLFSGLEGRDIVVIHTAAVIDITSKVSPRAQRVNVDGTQNMIDLSLEYKVYRFIYVSSVHAIPEAMGRRTIRETKLFSPEAVEGGYAKTKAEASRHVMRSVAEAGLPAVILHPSGIAGPMDSGTNNIVNAMRSYLLGRIPFCPRGGYDIVDVRDVAGMCIEAVEKARVGETYILSGRHYEFAEIFSMLNEISEKKHARCRIIPLCITKLFAPILERDALRKKRLPLITPYSLKALASNDNFSHEKASRELGFWPRDIYDTLQDTVAWLAGMQKGKKPSRRRAKPVTA
jgi:dihydroflavonol-4-reductase